MLRLLTIVAFVVGVTSCDTCKRVTGQCCKTCTDSKPCGDSCISRSQSCNKSGGCACSGLADEMLE
jgi:hypothetical protein